MEAAQRTPAQPRAQSEAPFSVDDLCTHLANAAAALRANVNPALHEIAATLDTLAADPRQIGTWKTSNGD